MVTSLSVTIVGRQLERFADRPTWTERVGAETFELANSRSTPRPLDEIIGTRLQ